MGVEYYELDRIVFEELSRGINRLRDWKGKASQIGDYVATWGVERFWAMSRSPRLRGGGIPDPENGTEEQRNFFAWGVARVVLCRIAGVNLGINAEFTTEQFQNVFRQMSFNKQALLADLLIEIGETIQFWTMRIADARENQAQV